MAWQEILGFIGGALITVGLIPQVWRLYKLKSAREISLTFTWLFLLGGVCWLSYGVVLSLPSLIVWNSVSICLMCAMIYAKLRYSS
jgi:MtN3 and saliva related transmembrane protein